MARIPIIDENDSSFDDGARAVLAEASAARGRRVEISEALAGSPSRL